MKFYKILNIFISETSFKNENNLVYKPAFSLNGTIENNNFLNLMDELEFLKTDFFDIFKDEKYQGQNIEILIKGKCFETTKIKTPKGYLKNIKNYRDF